MCVNLIYKSGLVPVIVMIPHPFIEEQGEIFSKLSEQGHEFLRTFRAIRTLNLDFSFQFDNDEEKIWSCYISIHDSSQLSHFSDTGLVVSRYFPYMLLKPDLWS